MSFKSFRSVVHIASVSPRARSLIVRIAAERRPRLGVHLRRERRRSSAPGASTALYDVRRVHLVPRQIVHALAVDRIRVAIVVVVVVLARGLLALARVARRRFRRRLGFKSVSRSVVRASQRRARRTFFAGGASAASTSLTRFAGTATSSSSLSLASALPLIASTIETRQSDDAETPERRAIATTRAMTTGDVWTDMAVIFTAILATMLASYATLTPVKTTRRRTTTTAATSGARWFACAKTRASKAEGEMFCLKYSACWIASVGVVIATRAYESFGRWGYLAYCGACAAPAIVAPLMRPSASDRGKALSERYIVKANVWIAVFSFIGNYWYTHYFYAVLKAEYTFDAHRLNDVPISMYLMTHAYFMFYHVLSNAALRRIRTGYVNDAWRFGFECAAVGAMAYSTAFMESLTICGFPYYSFADRHMAYTLGSAFYGIYFLVSFPMFLRVDETKAMPMSQVFWEAMGSGMAVLCLLDFVRVYLRIPFTMRIRG